MFDLLFSFPSLAAAAWTMAALNPNSLPLNWFDFLLLIIVLSGVLVGRKRGMSNEVLDVVQWITIVVVGALLYKPVGGLLADYSGFSLRWGYVTIYLLLALVVKIVFNLFKRGVGQKLGGSDAFGNTEYYLGMLAGAVRFLCILLFFLALFHAPLYTDAELAAQAKEMARNFETITFPTFGSIQRDIFRESLSGKALDEYAPFLLIESSGTGFAPARQKETIGRKRQKELDTVIGR